MKLRLPWYRGLPLSCVERLDIDIDGESVPADDITLSLYGYHHKLDELAALHEVTWFTLDAADVRVRRELPLSDGKHELAVTIQHRVPYVPLGDQGGGFKPVAKCTKTVILTAEEDA